MTIVGTVGETAIVPDKLAGWNIARAIAILPIRQNVGAYWVRLALRSPLVQSQIHSRLNTTVQATLNLRDVAQLPISLPPEDTRKQISTILGALDDKVELNRRMNENLEAMARTLFRDWFVDFGPTRAKMGGREPYLAPEIWSLFPERLDGEGKPEQWRTTQLEEVIAVLETGGRPKGGVANFLSGVPSVGAESIVGLGLFDYSKTKFIPHDFFESMKKGHVKDRDVLLYKDGGRPGEFEPHLTLVGDGFPFEKFAINEHVYRIRARADFGQSLLYFWLSSDLAMDEMRVKGTGVAIPGLNSTQVKSLTTILAPPQITHAFDARVEPLIAKVLANCNEARNLAQTRDLLLPKLMSGEIRALFEAEKMAEAAA
jgi:type I restriction enzyme S subunit